MYDGIPPSSPVSISPSHVNAEAPGAGGVTSASPAPVPAAGKAWWQSRTIIGAVIVILAQLLQGSGFEISADDPALTDLVAAIVSIIGGVLAILGRIRANRPVTSGVSAPIALLVAFLGALLCGCTTSAGRLQGSVSIGYRGGTVRLGSDGKTTVVDVQLPNVEGFSK